MIKGSLCLVPFFSLYSSSVALVLKLAPVGAFLNVFLPSPSFVLCCGIVLVQSFCFRHAVKKVNIFV